MAKIDLTTKYDLKDMVYAISRGRVFRGEIQKITAERTHSLTRGEWCIYYDMQVGESEGIWNIPERFVFMDKEEAETMLKKV
jgi:hypothetical protein